jgi:hypothetical protein
MLSGLPGDEGQPNRFFAVLEFFSQDHVDFGSEVVTALGHPVGRDAVDQPAFVVKGGVLSIRPEASQLWFRSPGLTGAPEDYVEDSASAVVPTQARALHYLKTNCIPPTPATVVADFEKIDDPFGLNLSGHALHCWIIAPQGWTNGINVLYLGPETDEGGRLQGVVFHIASPERKQFDPGEIADLLEPVLEGIGFRDTEPLLATLSDLTNVSAERGKVIRRGNLILARHLEPNRDRVFQWYSVGLFRRVAAPRE